MVTFQSEAVSRTGNEPKLRKIRRTAKSGWSEWVLKLKFSVEMNAKDTHLCLLRCVQLILEREQVDSEL